MERDGVSAAASAPAAAAPGTDVGAPAKAGEDGDGDWVGGAADDEVDDEGTLEEEEVRTCLPRC